VILLDEIENGIFPENQPNCAVLFRDSDRTRSSSREQWNDQWLSYEKRFTEAQYGNWIGLLPRPKSEVWFLCAMQETAYQNCEQLESLPGNDASPEGPKIRLDQAAARLGAEWE